MSKVVGLIVSTCSPLQLLVLTLVRGGGGGGGFNMGNCLLSPPFMVLESFGGGKMVG